MIFYDILADVVEFSICFKVYLFLMYIAMYMFRFLFECILYYVFNNICV